MPKYKVTRTQSPFINRNKTGSPSPRAAHEPTNFSLLMPQTPDSSFLAVSNQKMKLLSKLKVFTGLTPAIDRKSQRHESNVFASESKQEGANRTNFNFLTNGIKINKLQDVIRLASHVKPRFEIYEDRSLRVERRSQPNSLDG